MSAILPPQQSSATSGSRAPHQPVQQPATSDRFESLLTSGAASSGAGFALPADAGGLTSAIAEVFNAHGFFVAGPEAPEAAATASAAHVSWNAGDLATRDPVLVQSGATAVEAGSQPPRPKSLSLTAGDIMTGASELRTAVVAGSSPARPSGAGAETPVSTGKARRAGAASKEVPQAPASSRAASPAAATADRLLFRIGSHSVEILGRLQDLSSDEQDRLIEELGTLLAAYGFSIGQAKLNGTPMTSAFSRSSD